MEELLGPNRPEDVSWLCSLSESELDLLVILKSEVMRRAKLKGCDELAHKFDLKTLRALAFVMMTCVKDKVKNSTLAESGAYLESCNLLKSDVGDIMSLEEIRTCIGMDSRKTPFRRKSHKESTPKQKKRKRSIL